MKTNLEPYFEACRNAKPLVVLNDIENIIQKPKPGIPFRKQLIAGSFVVVCIAGGILYLNSTLNTTPEESKRSGQHSDLKANHTESVIAKPFEPTEQSVPETNKSALVKNKFVVPYTQESAPLISIENNPVSEATDLPTKSNQNDAVQYDPPVGNNIINLTNKELSSFGIQTNGKTLQYACMSSVNNDSTVFTYSTGPKGSISTLGSTYQDQHISKPENNTPVAIEINLVKERAFPLVTENLGYEYYDQFIEEISHLLVGIRMDLPQKAKAETADMIIWYKPLPEFMALLPVEIRAALTRLAQNYKEDAFASIVHKYKMLGETDKKMKVVESDVISTVRNNTITLTKNELKKLHIAYDGKSYRYKSSFMYKGKPCKLEILNKTGYKKISSYSIDYDNALQFAAISEEKAIYPVAVSDDSLSYLNIINIVKPAPRPNETTIDQDKREYREFIDRLPDLIGIRLNITAPHGSYAHIFWFADTSPVREIVEEHFERINDHKSVNLNGIQMVQLNDSNLKKLRIEIGKGTIGIPLETKSKNLIVLEFSDNGSSASFNSISKEEYYSLPSSKRGDSLKLEQALETLYFEKDSHQIASPVMATDRYGQIALFSPKHLSAGLDKISNDFLKKPTYSNMLKYQKGLNEEMIKKAPFLIPILVNSKLSTTTSNTYKMILWYEPTPEFLALLPQNIANDILSEYNAIQNNKPAPSCTYFEACKNIKGMISDYVIYPNPFQDEIQLELNLAEDRLVSIILTDIQGKVVKAGETNKPQPKGRATYAINAATLSEGIYLLLITTDKGERIVQRVIKRN